ncbi:MAG: type VII toxin-antitoxin system HepT family RNase toxin [Chloroflexia bacterium]
MMAETISVRVVADRLSWVEQMVAEIRSLPLGDRAAFLADRRNIWAAESCLRRALEALFDLGRHILAKGFALGVSEYKEIATRLQEKGVLGPAEAGLLVRLAGYRNRLVHFYHEVTPEELYDICATQLGDVEHLAQAYRTWLLGNPERLDGTL